MRVYWDDPPPQLQTTLLASHISFVEILRALGPYLYSEEALYRSSMTICNSTVCHLTLFFQQPSGLMYTGHWRGGVVPIAVHLWSSKGYAEVVDHWRWWTFFIYRFQKNEDLLVVENNNFYLFFVIPFAQDGIVRAEGFPESDGKQAAPTSSTI